MGLILCFVGFILVLYGEILFLIAAFKVHILWAIGCFFFPILGLVFLIAHWDKAARAFGWMLLGFVVSFAGFIVAERRHEVRHPASVPAKHRLVALAPAEVLHRG